MKDFDIVKYSTLNTVFNILTNISDTNFLTIFMLRKTTDQHLKYYPQHVWYQYTYFSSVHANIVHTRYTQLTVQLVYLRNSTIIVLVWQRS